MRKLKKAAIAAASAAALTLGGVGLAAPASASADDVGIQAVIGTAWTQSNFGGVSASLSDVGSTCTLIFTGGVLTADSALNFEDSTQDIQFFDDTDCGADDLIDTVVENTTNDSAENDFSVNVIAYKTV